ncbi:hypothetical protein SOV_48910 [Sporomusa ovata DSM 2662]|nr:hypothetical protein SOV_2c01600 [Sporomusa ovata DSM 2662]
MLASGGGKIPYRVDFFHCLRYRVFFTLRQPGVYILVELFSDYVCGYDNVEHLLHQLLYQARISHK